jgi:undecaprenyl-diphosphatase
MDTVIRIFLMLMKEEVIIPIIIFGMIFHKREPYAHAICFFCVIMIFNTFLKNLFKIPLLPHLGNGYAFPSGHMHAATIFYGYVLYKTNDWKVKFFLAFLICGIGFSLVYCNYHNWLDVCGAFGFAIVEIGIYRYLEKNTSTRLIAIVALIFSILIIRALFLMQKLEPHVWLGFYVLVGMIIGIGFFGEYKLKNIYQKIAALIFALLSVFAVYYLGSFLKILSLNGCLVNLKFLILPITVFLSMFTAGNIPFKKLA